MPRDQHLHTVRARLERYVASGEPHLVLANEALAEVDALLALADGRPDAPDLDVLVAAGSLFWCRHACDPKREADRDAALRLFAPVYERRPDLIPAAARRLLEAQPPPDPLDAMHDRAVELAGLPDHNGGSGNLAEAVQLLEQVVAAAPVNHPNRGPYLSSLGQAMLVAGLRNGQPETLRRSERLCRLSAEVTDADHPARPQVLMSLARTLQTRYELGGDAAALTEGLRLAREAAASTAADDPDRGTILADLCILLQVAGEQGGDPAAAQQAVEAGRQAVAGLPPPHPGRIPALVNLGAALLTAYNYTGEMADLTEAIAATRDALDADAANDGAHRPRALSVLALGLRLRYQRTGDSAVLAEAVTTARAAAAAAAAASGDGDLQLPTALINLVATLSMSFEATGRTADLDEAIAAGRAAADRLPATHPHRFRALSNLAAALRLQATYADEAPAALTDAVAQARQAAAATPAGHPDRAAALDGLAVNLRVLAQRTLDLHTLAEAVRIARQALAECRPDDRRRSGRLSNLAAALDAYANRAGDQPAAREAVAFARQAHELTNPDEPARAFELSGLSDRLLTLFRQTADMGLLTEAIELARAALARTPDGGPAREHRLLALSGALAELHDYTGDAAALTEAIELARRALALTPEGDPERAVCLHALSRRLLAAHRRTGLSDVLAEAIVVGRAAVAAVPADHPGRAFCLTTLANALRSRHLRTGNPRDAADAVAAVRAALTATPVGHPARPARLTLLSGMLRDQQDQQDQHDQQEAAADESDAVELARQALAATPDEHPDHAARLTALGIALFSRYESTRAPETLRESLRLLRQAADAVPPLDPDFGLVQLNLALALRAETERAGHRWAAAKAIDAFRQAAHATNAPASIRVRAAGHWGILAASARNWRAAADGFGLAIELLPQVAPRHLRRRDQEDVLITFAGLAADAAASALRWRDPVRAVELLEHGRGVLLAQDLDRHTDLSELRRSAPGLADRLGWLRSELDSDVIAASNDERSDQVTAASLAAQRRHELRAEWDALVARVRRLPGLTRFLLPPSFDALLAQAADGPVVLVNISALRSDALVLTPAGVSVVQLPDATPAAVAHQVGAFLEALPAVQSAQAAERARAERALNDVLAWLWDAVSGPVLDGLGWTGRPALGEPWPRIWWAPTGLLALLPLHAAGHHDERGWARPRTVMDRAVSSYTPTVRALAHARRRQPTPSMPGRLLVVSLPRTPGAADLPGAAAEARLLRELFPDVTLLGGRDARRDRVLAELPAHRWAHFACHSHNDSADISTSRLILHDHATRPLTVADISRLDLRDAEFAFLSACDTARPSGRLPDETVHISAAFLLAGYRGVVGTLWAIEDRHAVEAARMVYSAVAKRGATDGQVARALHRASLRARESDPESPSLWAAHVHVGS